MTTLKVNVIRKPTIKVKVLPNFPSSVTVTSPILLSRVGGNYAFSFDALALGSTLTVNADYITLGSQTGTGAMVRATSPTLVTPVLGTPASGVATNLTGLPLTTGITGILQVTNGGTGLATATQGDTFYYDAGNLLSKLPKDTNATRYLSNTGVSNNPAWAQVAVSTGISGFATGIATFLATPSSANLRAALTDEVGTGAAYFVGGALGTPASGTATNLTGLPLSGLTTQAAFTFVGNNTSGTAVPTAVDIATLTTKASPAAGDFVILSDQAASGAWKKATVTSIGASAGVTSVNGQNGVLTLPVMPQGRLTLQTGVPVMITTQSAKTTIFYTACQGNQVPISDGTNFVSTTITAGEISVATTDTAKSPAAIGASKVNDWFVWNDAGTIRVGHGVDWTNDTTRASGLSVVQGILVNSNSITNGPASGRGTYVGTTRSNASSQLDWIFGASAAGGTAAFFGVWNMYNRVNVNTTVTDSTASWTTATSATPAALDTGATGSGLNNRISAVHGLAEDGIRIAIGAKMSGSAANFAACNVGFALDATTVFDKQVSSQSTNTGVQIVISCSCENNYAPQLGFHFWQATQAGDGTNAGSISGGAVEGMHGQFRM